MRPLRFRGILTLLLVGTAAVVAVPGLVGESRRPWEELDAQVHTSEAILASAIAAIPASDLEAMSRFARSAVGSPPSDGPAFVASVTRDVAAIPPTSETPFPDTSAWDARLAADPEAASAFARSWPVLARARESAQRVGLEVNDVYLTVDEGVKPGFYQDNLAFILGSQPWSGETVYPGEAFDVTAIDGLFWRASYLPGLGGTPGSFGHNPSHDPLLPRFETDEWGTWYSVWVSQSVDGGAVAALTMDIEASAVKAQMIASAERSLAAVLLTLALVLTLADRVAVWLSRPLRALQRGATAVVEARYTERVAPQGSQEFQELIGTFNGMTQHLAERVNLLTTLEKLLSKELAEAAARDGLQLGGKEAQCTVLFTDFAGFSGLTANMKASEVVEALNDYFMVLIPIIKRHGGFVDKYIGDAIVAFFGAPIPLPNHADRAVQCAIAMQRAVRRLEQERQAAGKVTFRMRVGLNSGEVVVGAIGCDDKLEYTSIGETTNLAQRMETACAIGHVCLAAGTRSRLKEPLPDGVRLEPEGPITVKGYGEPVQASRLWLEEPAAPHD